MGKQMNISKKGKYKISQYQILRAYFLPILEQLHPTYFVHSQYCYDIFMRSNAKLLHRVNPSETAKYRMINTEIKCIAPEYILKRLDLIFHGNKSFKPQIVYTTKYN